MHDVRDENAGGFAGPVEPSAPVGRYAGAAGVRRQGAGTFAGDPDDQRQGSFGDPDGDAIVMVEDGAGHAHGADRLGVRQLLGRAAIADDRADRVIDDLVRTGRAVVVHEAVDIATRDGHPHVADLMHVA
jgi:hypothetical protein